MTDPKCITTATAEQWRQVDAIRETWIARQTEQLDPDRVRSAVARIWKRLDRDIPVVLIAPSPMSAVIWGSVLSSMAVSAKPLHQRLHQQLAQHGVCAKCGAPWVRVVEKGEPDEAHRRACGADASGGYQGKATKDYAAAGAEDPSTVKSRILDGMRERKSTWKRGCRHRGDPVPATVLDPFAGSGTTGVVANGLGRDFVGIELNPEYAEMAAKRIRGARPLFNRVELVT